jgi:hypothetical protein
MVFFILKAMDDFLARIENLKKIYEELSIEKDGKVQFRNSWIILKDTSFIKLYDFSQRININAITGYLESKIVSYLMNIHMISRPIYFSRHGESEYNHEDRIGGDPDLTQRGYAYAKKLNQFF